MAQELHFVSLSPNTTYHVELCGIEEQDGCCIRCNELFEHCGGSEEHSVVIPCLSSIKYTTGVVCTACVDGINQELSNFCILSELGEGAVKAVLFKL
jgi:hypothetical protein